MILFSHSMAPTDLDWTVTRAQEEYVCWSRMQAEAGQGLHEIVARKELERRAGGGLFCWGVGNAPAAITKVLARAGLPVRAVFSIMKSRPKTIDVTPNRTVVWRRYVDVDGAERPLPPHVLVTSRGDSAGGAKRVHYALMCRSDQVLELRSGVRFDPSAFRNAGGTGAPVGSSQVTALLRRVGRDGDGAGYEANLTAWLTSGYWVRLTDPLEFHAGHQAALAATTSLDVGRWLKVVADIRGRPRVDDDDRVRVGPLI